MMASIRNIFGKLRHDRLAHVLTALAVSCVIGDFFIVRAGFLNGDNVYAYNELSAFLHGDIFLHGWSLATDNYYLSDLPPYLLGEAIFGRTVNLIWLTPYFIFLFFLAACLSLIWQTGQTTRQRQLGSIAVILLIGLPFADPQSTLRVSTNHAAVIAYSVLGLSIANQILTKSYGRFWWLAAFNLVTFIVTSSDPQVVFYFILPLIALLSMRYWLFTTMRRDELLLLGNVIIFASSGTAFPYILSQHGGFEVATNVSSQFTGSISALLCNFLILGHHILGSFDALQNTLTGLTANRFISTSRLAVLLVVILLCGKIYWKIPQTRIITTRIFLGQWLVLGCTLLSFADLVSQEFTVNSIRLSHDAEIFRYHYVTPIYIYLSLAAIIQGQEELSVAISKRRKLWLGISATLAGALFIFAAGQAAIKSASRPAYITIAPQLAVTNWLILHHLNYGVGDYWTTQMVTALGAGKVIADPVILHTKLQPYLWANDIANLQAHRSPQFVVFTPKNDWNITLQDVTNTYGLPASVTNLNGYIIAILKPPA